MRVLLDTNVLVAAFATRGLCQDVLNLVLAQHALVVGESNLEELERVLRDKLRMPSDRIIEVVAFVRQQAEVVSPRRPATWPRRDEDDQWIAAAALQGAVEMLVTGDKDLLVEADSRDDVRIVTPRGFWDALHDPG